MADRPSDMTPADSETRPWLLALGGLIALAAAMGIGRFIYTPILPPMAEGLALSQGEAGLIASANFLGYLIGALAAASRQIKDSPRAWMLSALALSAVTTGAMGLIDGMVLFLALRFIGGAASAFVLVFSSALVLERLTARGRGDLSAVHFAGVGAGIALSAVITWLVVAIGSDWRAMWLGGGLASLLALAAAVYLVPPLQRTSAQETPESGPSQAGRLWLLVTAYGLFGFGYVITATFIIAIVRGSPEIQSFEPFVWLAVGLAAVPSVAAWAVVGRHIGITKAFALACLVEAVGVVASVLWIDLAGLLLAAIFLGGTFMAITALGLMAARSLSGDEPRRALAIMTAAFGLGQIVGPLVAGYGFDLTGSFLLPSLMAAVALCIAAALTFRLGN